MVASYLSKKVFYVLHSVFSVCVTAALNHEDLSGFIPSSLKGFGVPLDIDGTACCVCLCYQGVHVLQTFPKRFQIRLVLKDLMTNDRFNTAYLLYVYDRVLDNAV